MTCEALVLAGPTACGKSELAIEIAKCCCGQIISVDSCAVYRGMDIGSAKPDPGQRAAIVHHLLDVREPNQRYSAGDFAHDAVVAAAEIRRANQLPILCGGTMLYMRTLLEGLSPIPKVPEQLRKKAIELVDEIGAPAAYRRLVQIDPQLAGRLAPTDRQRIARALAVYEATGQPLSVWQQQRAKPPLDLKLQFVALIPSDRDALRMRIRQRTENMFAAGFVDEVRELAGRYGFDAEALKAVGYRQVCQHLRGNCNLEEARRKVYEATCQLARRQMTWLRRLAPRSQLVVDPLAGKTAKMIVRMIG